MGVFAELSNFWTARRQAAMPPPFMPTHPGAPPPLRTGISESEDWHRIRALPVRSPVPEGHLDHMEALLRRPEGAQALRPIQRQALWEAGIEGRGFFPIRVGGGKTLLSFLLPQVIGAERPMLLLPAHLIEKTARELRTANEHWLVCQKLRVASYQRLGRVTGAHILEEYVPDLIIADECQFLKNRRAAVTRRVDRYVGQYAPRMVLMGGTAWGRMLRHHAHMLRWVFGKGSPAPLKADVIDEWSQVLDESKEELERDAFVGALARLYPQALSREDTGPDPELSLAPVASARKQYFARLRDTPAVVQAGSDQDYNGSLLIRRLDITPRQNAQTARFFKDLRDDNKATDGWPLISAAEVWAVARQIALGLCYVWNPRPPETWLEARKRWCKFARDAITAHGMVDSELEVVNAVDQGLLDDGGLLEQWRRWKPTFVRNSEPRWHDTAALDACATWLQEGPGICWVEHVFFGEELSRRTGLPYFREKGMSAEGKFIEDASGPIIASWASNHTGRNLQYKWHRNLQTAMKKDADANEQWIGRTHRQGQQADCVEVDILDGCKEHRDAVQDALYSAQLKTHAGITQKILLADVVGF